jgi:DNA-3-methyladenine glycosylase I
MSSLLATGRDGLVRCDWALAGKADALGYHDREWGVPSHDPRHLFEILTLCGFAAGIRWTNVWRKREGFRAAFSDYELTRIAAMTDADVARLMTDPSIIRNQRKIEATIGNARAALALETPLAQLVWEYAEPQRRSPVDSSEFRVTSPEATALAKRLQQAGFRWVGPNSTYAFMQNVGIVNDHVQGCYLAA